MWCDATGLGEADAPMLDWQPPYRVDAGRTQVLRPRCPDCGQIIRSRALQVWEQKQLFAAGKLVPSWLSPAPVQRTDMQGQGRVVRARDDEASAQLFDTAAK
jgi:hypothetical protein